MNGTRKREPARSGDEQDVLSRKARAAYCWTKRAGACADVKRAVRRRERRNGKFETRED